MSARHVARCFFFCNVCRTGEGGSFFFFLRSASMPHVISYSSDLGRVKIKSVHQITVVLLIRRLIARDSTLVGYMGAYRPGSVSRQITRCVGNNPPRLLSWEGAPKLCTMCRLDFNRICCSDLTKASAAYRVLRTATHRL